MTRRMDRVNVLMREEISKVISTDLRDPRLARVVSITHVDTSADLRQARVHVSVLGSENEKRNTLEALRSASGYIHRTVRPNLSMKNVPSLTFILDDTIERGAELLELIKDSAPVPETSGNEEETP